LLDLRPGSDGGARRPASPDHQNPVKLLVERALRRHGETVAGPHGNRRRERHETSLDRGSLLGGVLKDLIRADGVELIEAFVDENSDSHGAWRSSWVSLPSTRRQILSTFLFRSSCGSEES